MSIQDLLNTAVDLKRLTISYGDMGGTTQTLSVFGASVPARISSSVPAEVLAGPTEYAEATAMIYVFPGMDIQREDEVHHGSTVYEVLGVRDPSVTNHHLEVVAKVKQ